MFVCVYVCAHCGEQREGGKEECLEKKMLLSKLMTKIKTFKT